MKHFNEQRTRGLRRHRILINSTSSDATKCKLTWNVSHDTHTQNIKTKRRTICTYGQDVDKVVKQ